MKEIDDLVFDSAPRILVLPVIQKVLDHYLSNTVLKEVPENRHLFEILTDDQSHGCYLCVDVIEGLSFVTRGNIVQKTGQVVDEFTVDDIREVLEFEQKLAPNLDGGNFPQGVFPFMIVSIILVR